MPLMAGELDSVLSPLPGVDGDYFTVRQDANGASWSHEINSQTIVTSLAAIQAFLTQPSKFARINLSAIGDTTLVAAVAGKSIRVTGYVLTSQLANAAVTLRFKSGAVTILAGHLELDGIFPVSYSGSIFAPAFQTAVGQALVANLSAAKTVEGHLTYVEV